MAVLDVTAQRKAAQIANEHLGFEQLCAELSAAFVDLPMRKINTEIECWLPRLAETLGVARASYAEFFEHENAFRITYSWTAKGSKNRLNTLENRHFPWLSYQLSSGNPVHFSRPDDLPREAAIDKLNFYQRETRSAINVPLVGDGGPIDHQRDITSCETSF